MLQTVTYTEYALDGSVAATHAGVTAWTPMLSGGVAGAGGDAQIVQDETRFHVEADTIPVRPRRGGRFTTASDGVWEVTGVDVCTIRTRYLCRVTRVA